MLYEVLSILRTKVSVNFYIFFFIPKLINITSDDNILACQLMGLFLVFLNLELLRKLQMKGRRLIHLKWWFLLVKLNKIILRFWIAVGLINHSIEYFFIIKATILSLSIFLREIPFETAMLLKWLIPLLCLSIYLDIFIKFTRILLTYSTLKYSISTFILII